MAEKDLVFGIKIDSKQAQKSTKQLSKDLEKSSEEFSQLQKEVDKTTDSLTRLQKVVDNTQKATKSLDNSALRNFKTFQRQNKVMTDNAAILRKQASMTKSNAAAFKDMESTAEGARLGLQLFGEVILGIPGDAVTKLFDSFEVLGDVIKKGFANSLKTAQAVIKKFLVVLKQLTIAIVTNPLFIKAGLIIAGIVAIGVAIADLEERLGIFSELFDSIAAIFGQFEEDTKKTATTLEILGRTFKNIGIILLSGFLTPLMFVVRGLLELRRALTTDEEALFKLDGQIAALEAKMIDFAEATGQAVSELNPFTASANIAAEKTAKLNAELEKNQAMLAKGIEGLTTAQVKAELFGDEFQNAAIKLEKAKTAMEEATKAFGQAKQGEKPIKQLTDASKNLLRANLELQKLSGDTFSDLAKQAKASELELLKATGQASQARREENRLAEKELNLLESRLISFGNLTQDQIKNLQDLTKQIKDNAKAQLDAIDAVEAKTKDAEDARKKKEETDAAIAKGGDVSGFLQQGAQIAEGLGGVLGDAVGGISEMLTGAAAEFGLSAAGTFITAILAIPDLLEGVAGFIDKITNIGPAIAEAFQTLATSVVGLIADFVPNLINAVTSIIDTVIFDLLIAIPDAFIQLSEAIPAALEKLIERLPEFIEALIRGLIVAFPKFIIAITNFFVKGIPDIIKAIVKALPDIGEAIIVGVIEAILEIGNLIQKLFSGEALSENISNSITEGVGEGLKASSSEVFQVLELEQERFAKGAGTFIVEATEKAISIWRRFWMFVSKLWDGFIKLLVQVWDTIILAVETVFNFVKEKIWDPVINALEKIFNFLNEKVFQPFIKGFNAILDFFKDVFDGFINAFTQVWEFIDKNVIGPFKTILEGVGKLFASIINPIIKLLNALGFPKVDVGGKVLGKSFGFTLIPEIDLFPDIPEVKFQEGGLVTGPGLPQEGDVVPALLTPGEFVLNRDAADALGFNRLNQLNQGNDTGGGATINFAPTINVSGGNFEPKQVIDDMFTELRRRSSNGTKVIFAQGIKT